MMDEDKLFTCGGYGTQRYVDYYDFINKKFVQLSNTLNDRNFSGIFVD